MCELVDSMCHMYLLRDRCTGWCFECHESQCSVYHDVIVVGRWAGDLFERPSIRGGKAPHHPCPSVRTYVRLSQVSRKQQETAVGDHIYVPLVE